MKNIFLIILLSISSLAGFAQNKNQLRLELYKPNNLFSPTNITTNGYFFPSNKGIAVGVEHDYKNKKRVRTYQTLMAGFYNEVYFERVVTLESNFGLSVKLFKGLHTGFEAGLGYNRAQSSNLVSVLENKKWVSQVDKSVVTNRLTVGLSLNLGYDFSNHFGGKLPVTIGALAGVNLLTPYIPESNIPIGLMQNNKLILKYRF
jgi:hypothetical protein